MGVLSTGNEDVRSLRELLVIDSLDVEVTRLETNRMSATYRVSANGETHETEFAYRYAESVFDPDDPADRNLDLDVAVEVLHRALPGLSEGHRQLLDPLGAGVARADRVDRDAVRRHLVGHAAQVAGHGSA